MPNDHPSLPTDRRGEPCRPRPIAANGVGTVARCAGCGQLQLSLEYLTLRFQPQALRELQQLLTLALRQMDATAVPAAAAAAVH